MCQRPSPYTMIRAKKKTMASAMPLTLYQGDCLLPDRTRKDLRGQASSDAELRCGSCTVQAAVVAAAGCVHV